ncbi:MAG: sugar phosphate nucleotidyltransferase [Bacteroidota bacterium]
MKVVIPVAGVGARLRPHTYTQPKPLIPVAGKPIISFIIDQWADVGVTDFVFVVGYLGDKIRDYLTDSHPGINKEFVYQAERKGLGHAIWTARETIQDCDEIIIALGDTILEADLKSIIEEPISCLGVSKVDDPREFGVCSFGDNGIVTSVVEKPKIPLTNMALVGLYKCTEVSSLIAALDHNITNDVKTIGEFQLTDALMKMIDDGVRFKAIQVENWFDCGKKDILLETNTTLLKQAGYASDSIPGFENTIIIPPVHIGEGCKISNSIIGPFTTIGDNSIIDYAIIKESIIGNYARIREIVLERSVVGTDASIHGLSQSLNIGDNTEIDFG